jgi:hypothetical protein
VAKDFPWVKELSGGIASGHPRRRASDKDNASGQAKAAGQN